MAVNHRVPFVGGNWKCMGTQSSVTKLVRDLNDAKTPAGVDICVGPTALHIPNVQASLDKKFLIAAQNCSRTGEGAFTGEISAAMLKDAGLQWVILGHSERRHLYGESNLVVAEKVAIALKAGLNVIACIGELLEERKAGKTELVLVDQLAAIAGAVRDQWHRVVIAYEPVWAIGTGVVASPEQAQEAHALVRSWLRKNAGAAVAQTVRVIYGGSVKANNSAGLTVKPDVDGFLVGGASLNATEFIAIADSLKMKSKL